jgi:hypothetical protein
VLSCSLRCVTAAENCAHHPLQPFEKATAARDRYAHWKDEVNVNLPMGLVDAGMNIATQFAPDIDFNQIAEAIRSGGMEGKIVDVIDEEDGEHVEVFID